jgi:plastocyanin
MKTLLISAIALLLFPIGSHAMTLSTDSEINSGDLFRGETYASVYYLGEDGLRYIFPNDKTYFTWHEDFTDIKWISDTSLSQIQIGGNVTYKPGVKMVKITTDPTVYAVGTNGTLHAIDSEEIAAELYGEDWNQQIDDIPDYLFGNYQIGSSIDVASQFDSDAEKTGALSINDDKSIVEATLIEITEAGYQDPTITIKSGTAVRWLNVTNDKNSVREWDRVWGSGTMNPGANFARYFTTPGTWHYYSHYSDRNIFEGAIIVE